MKRMAGEPVDHISEIPVNEKNTGEAAKVLRKMVAEMIEHAEKAWEIGGQITNMLVPDGDDEVFDIINEIQCCEETDVDSAVERLLKAAGEKEE